MNETILRPAEDGEAGAGEIRFLTSGDGDKCEILMKSSGEFLINGRLVATDLEVYEGFKQFIAAAGYPMPEPGEPDKVTELKGGDYETGND